MNAAKSRLSAVVSHLNPGPAAARAMSSSSKASSKPNASGLLPNETKGLPTRQPNADEQAVLNAMKEVSNIFHLRLM